MCEINNFYMANENLTPVFEFDADSLGMWTTCKNGNSV